MSSTDVKTPSWIPRTEADFQAIRLQLTRVLESAPFRTSKRYPALLSYVVEKTLQGDTDSLKERTLGIEVFRREPEYDTNADPVVRIAAGEVRKRLAQYYSILAIRMKSTLSLLPDRTFRSSMPRRMQAEMLPMGPTVQQRLLQPGIRQLLGRFRWRTGVLALVARAGHAS